jgi:hypothetical protein
VALMLGNLCDPLRAGGAPDDVAREAAEVAATCENGLGRDQVRRAAARMDHRHHARRLSSPS